jgi:hypothetical protein
VPLFYCMNLFSLVNSVWHNFSFTHNYYSFTQSLLVVEIYRWQTLVVPLMRPLRQVVMVLGQVVVEETTSTTVSPAMNPFATSSPAHSRGVLYIVAQESA